MWQQDAPFVQPGIAHAVTVRVNQQSEVGGVESIPLVPSECVRVQSNQASHILRHETREQQHCVYREQNLEEGPVEDVGHHDGGCDDQNVKWQLGCVKALLEKFGVEKQQLPYAVCVAATTQKSSRHRASNSCAVNLASEARE